MLRIKRLCLIALCIFPLWCPVNPGVKPLSLYAAQDIFLQGIFFADVLAPPAPEGFSSVKDPTWKPSYTQQELADAVFTEASWVFSGMIWGFTFEYTPSDKARNIAEFFELAPRGSIKGGTGRLKVLETSIENNALLVNLLYYPGVNEASEYIAWKQATYKVCQGQGSGPAFPPLLSIEAKDQAEARIAAMTSAAKEALRSYLRGIVYNKPRIIRGTCAFLIQPSVIVASGQYLATVRLAASVTEIVSYGAY